MAIDVFGREVKIGDYIAASTLSYKSANLRVGEIISFGPKSGLPSVRFVHSFNRNGKEQKAIVDRSKSVGTFVLIPKESLPQIVVDALERAHNND